MASEVVTIDGQEIAVTNPRKDGRIAAGDVVELLYEQDAILPVFQDEPDEAARSLAEEFVNERMRFEIEDERGNVRGLFGELVSARGFEQDGKTFVRVRLRMLGFDSRPPEMVEPEELEAAIPIAALLYAVAAIAIGLVATFALREARLFVHEVNAPGGSAFGFGLTDAIIVVALAWAAVAFFKAKATSNG